MSVSGWASVPTWPREVFVFFWPRASCLAADWCLAWVTDQAERAMRACLCLCLCRWVLHNRAGFACGCTVATDFLHLWVAGARLTFALAQGLGAGTLLISGHEPLSAARQLLRASGCICSRLRAVARLVWSWVMVCVPLSCLAFPAPTSRCDWEQ